MNEFTYEAITTDFGGQVIKRTDADGNEAWIPVDPANADYAAYLESLNDNAEAE